MLIKKAIMSSDDNPKYLDFWPIVSMLWKQKFGIEPVLLYFGKNGATVSRKFGTVVEMPTLDGIPLSTQCQCSRLWYAGQCGEDVVITSDIDMLPLSPKYFVHSLTSVTDDKYVHLNPLYDNTYFPMCYNVAKSSTLNKVLDIDSSFETFMEKVMKWSEGKEESLKVKGLGDYWFLDEKYTSHKVNEYKKQHPDMVIPIPRKEGVNGFRIDRPNWVYSLQKLSEDYYYDCHSIRPYKDNKKSIDEIAYSCLSASHPLSTWGSHLPIISEITKSFEIDSVLEFGTGFFSTSVFVENCKSVLSIEMQNKEWYDKVKDRFQDKVTSGVLDIRFSLEDSGEKTIDSLKFNGQKKYDLVFVYGAGGSRPNCCTYAKTVTDLIILHDTQQPTYGWNKIVVDGDWKWVDIKLFNTWTSIMTKRKDVLEFVESFDYFSLLSKYRGD